ncbi:MAG: HEAT repeat domain-containing protein [Treponema sp.]|nr:HEAT repeat domain-containing protein [Treponema sp.]
MFSAKRFFILIIIAAVSLPVVSAQMTVEESYLQDSLEIFIITQTASGFTRDQKVIALQYIGEALDRGNSDDRIRQTLETLSLEGTRIVSRESGRVVNNFPDIRRQAARYLGQIGTEEARQSLILVCISEREPMVLMEAITSLGNIGTNPDNSTVTSIVQAFRTLGNNPNSLMAIATLDALEKIARNNNGLPENGVTLISQIANDWRYEGVIRQRAWLLHASLRNYR